MIGGKAESAHRPTALGTMLNAASYGRTKTMVLGTTLATLIAIWSANLRKGGSSKKGKKGKGPPTYVENVDFYLASNPVLGTLQVWSNNTNRYTLDFVRVVQPSAGMTGGRTPYTWMNSFSVADAHFYAVVAVTADAAQIGAFNDYGAPGYGQGGIGRFGVAVPGTGYNIGDTFEVTGGGGTVDAICQVVTLTGGAGTGVSRILVLNPGNGYTLGPNYGTTALTGGGSGAIVFGVEFGTGGYDSLTEYPLWNVAQNGPDIIQSNGVRGWPFVYWWTPAFGNTIFLPSGPQINYPGGNYYIYYMRTNASTKRQSPIAYNRMTFEPVLGDGTEYADAGLSSQQDLHPCDAGLGSSDIDLGVAGLLPDWRVETEGSYPVYSHGDTDFSTMIEEVFKSGQIQTGLQLGLIHRGLNCNDIPGIVQASFYGQTEPYSPFRQNYYQANNAGSLLIAFYRWRASGGSNATIADAAGNTWTPVIQTPANILAYAHAIAALPGNVVTGTFNGGGFAFDARSFLLEMDPSSDTVEATDVHVGTSGGGGSTITASVTVTGPAYLIVFSDDLNVGAVPQTNPHWRPLNVSQGGQLAIGIPTIMYRYVAAAGTYTWSEDFAASQPYYIAMLAISQSQPPIWPQTLGNILDDTTLQLMQDQCRAGGLIGSIAMDSQKKASEWLKEFYTCADTSPVWSGFKLKSVPRSEVSAVGNGVLYTSPTAAGPIVQITQNDIIGDATTSPVTISRKGKVDATNVLQIQHLDRSNDYHQSIASLADAGSVAKLGTRKDSPMVLHEIQDPAVALKILAIENRRKTQLMNSFNSTITQKFFGLEAGDLIQIPDPNNLLSYIDVRLTKVEENDKQELVCEADPFYYGLHAPNVLPITAVTPNNPDSTVVPALVNAPIFFEPPVAMTVNNAMELWIPVSDADPNYGGCFVWVSTNGGGSYGAQPVATIYGNAVTGLLTALWPAGLDPDTVNDLSVDLTESIGALASYSLTDENNFVYPFYVEGSTTCGYELGSYSTATLTSLYHYTIPASPNGIRRGIYHQPTSGPVSHSSGKRFAFLGAASVANNSPFGDGSGIAKLALQPIWIGQTLTFKFQAFNALGGGLQDLADCVAYTYVPGNCAVIPPPAIVTIPVTSSAPGTFSVPHGLSYTPAFITVQMTSGGDIQPQSPLSVDGTNVYLDASDTGLTALVTLWAVAAAANVALSSVAGGNFAVPHGLASTPTISISQAFNLTGDFWRQGTPYTSTNLNLVASDAGVIGKDYAWVTPPTTALLPRSARIALAPGAGGNFTVAHGLAYTPQLVIVRMSSGGHIWLQTPFADATNIYLTASDAGITGEAMVWG